MNIIREYIYALAKFLAGDIMGKASYYRYSEKTRQKKSFKKVVRICDKILSKIEPIFTNMYGKVHFRKLYRLGEELMAQIYVPFDIYPAKYHFRARFILSFSSESKDWREANWWINLLKETRTKQCNMSKYWKWVDTGNTIHARCLQSIWCIKKRML